jgi:hypothetical protein
MEEACHAQRKLNHAKLYSGNVKTSTRLEDRNGWNSCKEINLKEIILENVD